MIYVDTDAMLELASVMRSANEQITEAVQLLNRTVEHNDWGCRERVAINENTVRNKQNARVLQEASASFSNAVSYAANEFVIAERSISDLVSGIDEAVGNVISAGAINAAVTQNVMIDSGTDMAESGTIDMRIGRITQTIVDSLRQLNWTSVVGTHLPSYAMRTFTDAIPACNFSDISFGNGG